MDRYCKVRINGTMEGNTYIYLGDTEGGGRILQSTSTGCVHVYNGNEELIEVT